MSGPPELPNTIERFDGLADRYDRYRPTYPATAIEAVLAGSPPGAIVADVGAGTGISTRALAAYGARAIAIEPNDDMREIARAKGADVRAGRAQATGLPDASVDIVTCFQAFHWFGDDAAIAEFARILRPNGRLAIVWNERDLGDPASRAYRAIEVRHTVPGMLKGANFADERLAPLVRAGGFSEPSLLTFINPQRVDRDGLRGRLRSSSYAPREGPHLAAMIADADALFDDFADATGHVNLAHITEVWLSRLVAE